jgi:hypothetical protein
MLILQLVDPLVGNDLKTKFAARQQVLNKQVYAAVTGNDLGTNMFPRKILDYNNERCFLLCPCRDVITAISLEVSRLTRVEAGSNTSTVTLRVEGGDEKRSLESETVKYGHDSYGTRTRK